MTSNHSLLAILQDHAQSNGENIAHLLPDRVITYRRFWSRIERASARLQGEWDVKAGDIVIYWGQGHPDAIILYCALLRLGAKLLPCENCDAEHVKKMVDKFHSRLVVHDDELHFSACPAQTLSSLLVDWCHFDPVLVQYESSALALYLPNQAKSHDEALSIDELIKNLSPLQESQQAEIVVVNGPIFLKEKLTQLILPALIARRRLQFSLIEPFRSVS